MHFCQIHTGEEDFSIDQWNETFRQVENMGLSETERNKILHPEPCKRQCETCLNIVLDTRLRTQALINKYQIKS